jgi:hypothetical protein
MRLFEVSNNFSVDLTTVLRNILGRNDDTDSPVVLSYKSISNLLSNMGYGEINFAQFDKIAQSDPAFQPDGGLIADYNESGITLATKAAKPADAAPVTGADSDAGKSVDQMAHNAVQDLTS